MPITFNTNTITNSFFYNTFIIYTSAYNISTLCFDCKAIIAMMVYTIISCIYYIILISLNIYSSSITTSKNTITSNVNDISTTCHSYLATRHIDTIATMISAIINPCI